MIRKIVKLSLIVFCMGLIFCFSMDTGEVSTKKSDGVIVKVCEFFVGGKMSEKEREMYINRYVVLVRKGAHFGIYFLLGFLTISFLKEFEILSWRSILGAILFVFLYACSDEIHQLFVSNRNGDILDVFLDTIGGSVATIVYFYFYRLRRKIHE